MTIPDGKKSVLLVVQPIDDAASEGTETLTLRILPGSQYTASSKSRAAVTLIDDDGALR